MSTTRAPTRPTPTIATPAVRRRSLWQHGIAAAVVAPVATSVIAALTSAAGVSFADATGAHIPIAGFAHLTLVFSLFGVGIAAVVARNARRPRAMFVRTALTQTALFYIPDLPFGFDTSSAATLITLHTVAAAFVIPTLAGRLARKSWLMLTVATVRPRSIWVEVTGLPQSNTDELLPDF